MDLPAGVRVSQRHRRSTDDIALALAAPGVRIFAPIPGTNYVGIEVPNRNPADGICSATCIKPTAGPWAAAGGHRRGRGGPLPSFHDLAKMPHRAHRRHHRLGQVGGQVNAMIMSILMRATPAEVRFIMVDPKRVEFAPYEGIPHLYVPVVTERQARPPALLRWGVAEMERRLKVFSKVRRAQHRPASTRRPGRRRPPTKAAEEAGGRSLPENALRRAHCPTSSSSSTSWPTS